MTAHDIRTVRAAQLVSDEIRAVRHPIGEIKTLRLAKRLVVYAPSAAEIGSLVERARQYLPQIAGLQAVHRVVSHNPDSLWAIARRERFSIAEPSGEGVVAFLMLNEAGLQQLVQGTFNASDPDLSLLTRQHEKPAGIYVWLVHAPGSLAAGAPLAFQKVWSPLYRDIDLYTRSINAEAVRFVETMGFRRGAEFGGIKSAFLHVYRRSAPQSEERPAYDGYEEDAPNRGLSVSVVRTIEDLMRVVAIRGAVYIAEQECPYLEEYDGNDFAATHLLGFVGDEPAGCLRIRCFADFAKIERLAVRKEFRNTRLSFQLVRAGINLCRMKGYHRLYGHAQQRLVNFWSRFGFRKLEGGRELVFSDFDYVEMVLDTTPHPNAVAIGGDPYVILRPEGRWHAPGILERSASRAVTRPSVDRRSA